MQHTPNTFFQQQVNISDDTDLLVILLDTNPFTWGKRKLDMNSNVSTTTSSTKNLISFSQFIQHLLVFINAYLSVQRNKKIAILSSATNHQSQFLFPKRTKAKRRESDGGKKSHVSKLGSNIVGTEDVEEFFLQEIKFETVQKAILSGLFELQENISNIGDENSMMTDDDTSNPQKDNIQGFSLSGALSMALCFINRLEKEKPPGITLNARILIFQVSPDISSQYISVMNTIFSAEKMNIILDACVLALQDSIFLQQACFLTNGNYVKPQRQEGLIQYLFHLFMLEKNLRTMIMLPVQNTVDFRASCFETRKPIDDGYVCPVCLSIFSQFKPVCSTCESKLQRPTNRSLISHK
ncbi:hypothetical protein ABK040_000640 [Willaertia magna]